MGEIDKTVELSELDLIEIDRSRKFAKEFFDSWLVKLALVEKENVVTISRKLIDEEWFTQWIAYRKIDVYPFLSVKVRKSNEIIVSFAVFRLNIQTFSDLKGFNLSSLEAEEFNRQLQATGYRMTFENFDELSKFLDRLEKYL